MKRTKFLAVMLSCVVLTLAAVCFVGCKNNLYSDLSKISNAKYANVTVAIATEQNGATLTSTFEVHNNGSESTVNYSVQQFATIDPDASTPSDNATTTSVGKVTLENGKVTQQTGDEVSVNFGDVTQLSLHFAEAYFTDTNAANGIFSAKVTNPRSFMDAPSLECTDMTVTFDYANSAEHVIIIHYTSQSGAAVTLNYTLN